MKKLKCVKKCFLQTLAISDKAIWNNFKRLNISPVLVKDQRGKHTNCPLSITDNVKNCIRDHINSFSIIDSHYIRAESTQKYLESGFTISKMHRLYLEWIKEKHFTSTHGNYENIINVTLRLRQYLT